MAVNRFSRIIPKDHSWQTPDIKVWEPNYDQWLDTLEKQQAKFDTIGQLEAMIPKHLQQDAPDVQQYTKGVQENIKKITDTFASGDVAAGNRMLRDVTSKVRRDWMPGGAADQFQQRLQKFTDIDKRLQETYLDPKSKQYAPELYIHYKKKIEVQPYKTDIGFGTIGEPTQYQYFGPEDWTNLIDKTLGNISADQVALRPGLIPSGVPLKSFFKTGNKEYIDKNKVLNALIGTIPPEMLKSLQVYSEATGTDAITAVQRMMESAAQGKAFEKYDYNYQAVTDDVELEKFKSGLRRQEKKEEFDLDNIRLRTQIFNSNSGMPEWKDLDISVGNTGKVTKYVVDPGTGQYIGGNELIGGPRTIRKETGAGFKDWIWTQEAPKQIQGIANQFAQEIANMSDKQAYDFVQQKYDEKRQALSNTDAIIQPYNEDQRKMWTDYLIGTTKGKEGATLGAMFQNDMTATTIMPGEVSTLPGTQLGQAMGVLGNNGQVNPGRLRHYIENAVVSENVEVPSGTMPSGHKVSYVDPDGKSWVFILGPRSLQEEQLNSDAYQVNQVKRNDAFDNVSFQPVHPILKEYFPNGIEVDSKDVYTSDMLYNQWYSLFQKGSPDAEKVRKQYDEVQKNPYQNNFVMKDVRILDPITKQPVPLLDDDGKPIKAEDGSLMFWTDEYINKLTRNTEIK